MKFISTYFNSRILFLLIVVMVFINMFDNIAYSKLKKGFYLYSNKELLSCMKTLGYSEYFPDKTIDVSRSSDGSAIIFLSEHKKMAIIIQEDGSIKEINLPGYPVWFNKHFEIVAWHVREIGLVFYKDGMKEKICESFPPSSGPDPSGNYFIKKPTPSNNTPLSISCRTAVYSLKNPMIPLLKINSCGISKIFLKNNQLFLFTEDYHPDQNRLKDSIAAYYFQIKNSRLIELGKTMINRPTKSDSPFYVLDFSPWNDDVLLIDVYDFPQRSRLYLFNMKTRKMDKIGKMPFLGGTCLFLKSDLVRQQGQRK